MRRVLQLAAGVLLAGALLTTTPDASAAPPKPDAAVTEAARARVAEGLKLYAKKRYDRAQVAFLQAYGLTRSPPVLLVLGVTALKLERPLEALHYFQQFEKDAHDPTPEQKARAEQGSAEARRSLAGLEIIAPEGAEISVDGEAVGRAPLSALDVLPGRHTLTSTTSSGVKSETVDAKRQTTVKVRLGAATATVPGARSSEPVATEPVVTTETPSGTPGGVSETTGIFAPPDTMVPVYVAGALGVVSLSVAIVLSGLSANADRNTSVANDALARNGKDRAGCAAPTIDPTIVSVCSTLRSAQHTSDDVKAPFVATLAVGAGATAFALGWYLFAPKAGAPPVAPSATPNGFGISVHATF